MAFGGDSGFAAPPGEADQNLEHYFTQIQSEIEELFGKTDFGDVTVDSLTSEGAVTIEGTDGIDFSPGSDTDVDLLTVNVTGTPTISWDETFSRFVVDEDLDVIDRLTVGTLSSVVTIDGGSVQFPTDGNGSIGSGGNDLIIFDNTENDLIMGINPTTGSYDFAILFEGDVAIGTGSAIPTTATDGFLLISGGAGAPTGTPSNAAVGWFPVYYDDNGDELYIYNGSWRSVALT